MFRCEDKMTSLFACCLKVLAQLKNSYFSINRIFNSHNIATLRLYVTSPHWNTKKLNLKVDSDHTRSKHRIMALHDYSLHRHYINMLSYRPHRPVSNFLYNHFFSVVSMQPEKKVDLTKLFLSTHSGKF